MATSKTENKTKKSGAVHKLAKKKSGETSNIVIGWKAHKYIGMIKYFVTECKHTKQCNGDNGGDDWLSGMAVTITQQWTGVKTFYFGMFNVKTKKVIIKDLGLVLNPKAPNGGVVARIRKK